MKASKIGHSTSHFNPYRGFNPRAKISAIEAPIGKWIGPPKGQNSMYLETKCSIKNCTGKAFYRWSKKAFCEGHKAEAYEWTAKHPRKIFIPMESADVSY